MQAPHKARPSGRQARPSTGVPALSIKYDVTEDLPSGQSWPPDGADFLVHRLPQRCQHAMAPHHARDEGNVTDTASPRRQRHARFIRWHKTESKAVMTQTRSLTTQNLEIKNIADAARDDAAFEAFLVFKKVTTQSTEKKCRSAANRPRIPRHGSRFGGNTTVNDSRSAASTASPKASMPST